MKGLETDLFKSFFEENSLMQHHIDSFNELLDNTLPMIIKEYECTTIDKNLKIYMQNIRFHTPNHMEPNGKCIDLTPDDTRLRNLTYSGNITLDIDIHLSTGVTSFANVLLCNYPSWLVVDFVMLVTL